MISIGCVDRVMAAAIEGRPAVKAILQAEIDDALTRASGLEVVIEGLDDNAADAVPAYLDEAEPEKAKNG